MAYAVKHARKSTAQIVLEAVQDLHAKEQIVTRETLAEVTGMKLVVIDDRLSYLTDNGKVRRVQRGVYVPVEQHKPARLITRTLLPDHARAPPPPPRRRSRPRRSGLRVLLRAES